jgi:hypothetical protein
VSNSVGLLVIVLATAIVSVLGILIVGRARKEMRSSGSEGLASRAGTQRFLAENWTLVEETARNTGMSDDEIAQLRANVLGVGESSS